MKKLNGAEIAIECLLEQGVDVVFGYPGGAVLHIYDALYKYSDKIRHILTAHEQGAAHAADGYARSTGKTGVVIATSGPGATNLVTGIATAYMDSVPMVAITGNVSCSLLGLDSFQEVDITGITMPITKHNYIVKDINALADTIRKAFYIANEGRKGPVLIDIPKDISAAVLGFENKPITRKEQIYKFCSDEVEQAVKLIEESERPYIYTGGGVISSGANEQLSQFVSLLDAPISSSLMGCGCYDQTDEKYIGMLGMHGTKASALALAECDLLIAIGSRFSDRVIGDPEKFAKHAKVLHIDIDKAEINKNIKVYNSVIGDVAEVLSEINGRLNQKYHKEWVDKCVSWSKEYPLEQKSVNDGVTPKHIMETLYKLTGGDAVITTEVGQNQMWACQFYKYKNPRSFISSGGLGTMGYGLGASIGAKIGNPGKTVINIAGDGSFHMNLNELVTLSKHNIPVIELVMNNNVLGMVRQWQRLFYDKRFSETTLERPTDYLSLAKAFGIKGYVIEKQSDVEGVLREAISLNSPVLIECKIDKDLNVLPMVPAGKPLDDMMLEIEL